MATSSKFDIWQWTILICSLCGTGFPLSWVLQCHLPNLRPLSAQQGPRHWDPFWQWWLPDPLQCQWPQRCGERRHDLGGPRTDWREYCVSHTRLSGAGKELMDREYVGNLWYKNQHIERRRTCRRYCFRFLLESKFIFVGVVIFFQIYRRSHIGAVIFWGRFSAFPELIPGAGNQPPSFYPRSIFLTQS